MPHVIPEDDVFIVEEVQAREPIGLKYGSHENPLIVVPDSRDFTLQDQATLLEASEAIQKHTALVKKGSKSAEVPVKLGLISMRAIRTIALYMDEDTRAYFDSLPGEVQTKLFEGYNLKMKARSDAEK